MVAMKSFTSDQVYHIHTNDAGEAVACDCPSYTHNYRRVPGRFFCKHMRAHNENVERENAASRSRYHFAQYDF